jgi:hypothetical protein
MPLIKKWGNLSVFWGLLWTYQSRAREGDLPFWGRGPIAATHAEGTEGAGGDLVVLVWFFIYAKQASVSDTSLTLPPSLEKRPAGMIPLRDHKGDRENYLHSLLP